MIISGADSYPQTMVVPNGNAPALANDLQALGEDLADRTTFMMARSTASMQSLKYECTDGDNIVFAPVFGIVAYDTMPHYMQVPTETVITVANIEGGIPPIGSSFYYIYLRWNAGPVFELSLAEPDIFKLYKSTGTDQVLVGVAQTEATAKFTKFRAVGRQVWLLEPPKVRNESGTGATPEIVDLSARMPPIAEVCCLSVNATTTVAVSAAFAPFVAVGPLDHDPTKFRTVHLPTGIAFARASTDIEVPIGHRPRVLPDLGNDRKLSVLTDKPTSQIELLLTGYKF